MIMMIGNEIEIKIELLKALAGGKHPALAQRLGKLGIQARKPEDRGGAQHLVRHMESRYETLWSSLHIKSTFQR